MDTRQRERLERYFKHSRRFLWGLGKGNQQETYQWLWNKGFRFSKGAYDSVGSQLLQEPGIERLLRDVVIPRVREQFTDAALEYLRACWNAGTRPDPAMLRQFNVRDVTPFVDVNTQYNYVEGWGEFAPVWFEEIEPALGFN